MAIMYPRRLPDRILTDRKLKGERGTYEALSKLSDDFEIFYNRCVSVSQGSKAYKRRIDFIILHEKLGLLAMEVKGGKIRIGQDGGIEQYHPSTKDWASIDPYGQVERATIALIKECKANGANHWIPGDTCVVFPNTLRRDITDTPHILPNGTVCADDLPIIVTQIPTLFSKVTTESAWSRDAFLDMRRRLQNMPEAKKRNAEPSDTSVSKRRFSKSFPAITIRTQKTKKVYNKPHVEIDPEEDDESVYVEENRTRISSHGQASHYSRNYIKASSSHIQDVKLQRWQIAAAIVSGVLASLAYAWFLPNSFLQRIF